MDLGQENNYWWHLTPVHIFHSFKEYPDYYTLIKKPIDMAKINSKLNSDQYTNLDDFLNDFYLMFDNACKYNEPDSQVYKVGWWNFDCFCLSDIL